MALTAEQVRQLDEARYRTFFWQRVAVQENDACWPWTKGRTRQGYGQLRRKVDGAWQTVYAHREAYRLVFGAPPDGFNVCHHCDNPPCCNPAHMFAATWAENMDDMRQKGRQATGDRHGTRTKPGAYPWGERHCNARLTADRVREIRALVAAGHEQKQVAARFGVHPVTVHDVIHGKTWKAVR